MTLDEALACLGLGTLAAPAEVRRAYLRRVKHHGPERDPTRFMEIRAAYELVMAALARATPGEQDTAKEPPPPEEHGALTPSEALGYLTAELDAKPRRRVPPANLVLMVIWSLDGEGRSAEA